MTVARRLSRAAGPAPRRLSAEGWPVVLGMWAGCGTTALRMRHEYHAAMADLGPDARHLNR
jgi:hypothetical protein